MSSTASTSITASPTKGTITASPSSGIGTTTPSTGMTMTTSNSGSLSPLEQEIFALKTQLSAVSAEKNVLQETLRNMQFQSSPDECDSSGYNRQSQSTVYEARLTELHSVIAELKKQLDIRREHIIPEESTDFEDDYELDAEDLLSIDENPHLNSTDKSLRMNFINAKTTKGGARGGGGGGLGLRSNQNLHRNNHHNSNNSTILLTTPSDDEDELESSSGIIDSSPVNNHPNDDNNLPSDVDVDGDYFEDDQIITTEGFGLKCVELSNEHHETDVIDTQRLTTWLDGNKTTLATTTAADSNNCNIESMHNPLNHNKSSSGILASHHKDGKYDRDSRNVTKHHADKSIDFSPLSSPESPEDNNEGPLSLLSATTNIKCDDASVEDEEDDQEHGIVVVHEQDTYNNVNHRYDIVELDDDRRGKGGGIKVGLLVGGGGGGGVGGRSSGRNSLQQQQQQQQLILNYEQSPQQHRRQVRRHRRNNSNNSRRNRDNNFICQVTSTTSSTSSQIAAPTSAGGKALEIQDRERGNNAHLRGNRHPSTLHAMLSACKRQEKLREEFPIGGGGGTITGGLMNASPGGGGGGLVITSMRTTPSESPSPESKPPVQFASLCQEVAQIRQEHAAIKDNLYKKEGELDQTRSALENIAKERDFLKNKVSELEQILKQSPKRLAHFSPIDLSSIPLDDAAPVCKLAERVKLSRQGFSSSPSSTSKLIQQQQLSPHHHHGKSQSHVKGQSPGNTLHSSSVIPNGTYTIGNDCSPSPEVHRKTSSRHSRSHHKHQHNSHNNNSNGHNHQHSNHPHIHPPPQPPEHQQHQHCGLTGADLMLIGQACSTRVVEHLVQPIKNESALREMQHALSQNGISPLNEEKLREFEIETERLSSKIEHLRSQNDVLTLNLEDAKSQADRLTVLLGKYESNNVALQLAVGYSDHTIEAYDILVALLESELGQLLANLRATGIGANLHHHSIIPVSTTSALSSPNFDPTSCLTSSPSSSAHTLHQQPYQPTIITTTPATPITAPSSCNSSGNNNNSNDNSPTGEHSRTSVAPSSSNSNNISSATDHYSPHREPTSTTTTTTTAALILATSTTTSTTLTANTPLFTGQEELDVRALIERANENRLTAENAARVLLSRFMVDSPGSENNNSSGIGSGSMVILSGSDHHHNNHSHHGGSGNHHHHCPPGQPAIQPLPLPWEETSSCSQTLSSASSLGDTSNGSPTSKPGSRQGGELIKNEETRIRDLIITLKTERETVKGTATELESWSMESLYPSKPPSPCDILEARKLDLETAVLMQELMAMREERAELRAQLFLLEKEKTSLELRLQSHETQEEAYKARINYLKSEILDYQNSVADPLTQQKLLHLSPDGNANNSSGGAASTGNASTVNPVERELVLKKRIQELASALEKVTHNSKMREKQNHEMIGELKRANGILIETLEAVKKKYQSRIRKMEEQIMAIMERHSMQLKLHKDRIHYLELENKEQRSQQQQQQQQQLSSD